MSLGPKDVARELEEGQQTQSGRGTEGGRREKWQRGEKDGDGKTGGGTAKDRLVVELRWAQLLGTNPPNIRKL